MNIQLKDKLMEVRNLTEKIMVAIDTEELEKVEFLLGERQKIIESLNGLNYSKQEFKQLFEECEILKLHNELEKRMKSKKEESKNELLKLKKSKQAYNGYNKNYLNNSFFIKEKI